MLTRGEKAYIMKKIDSELFIITDGKELYDEEGLIYSFNLPNLSLLAMSNEDDARAICEKLNLEVHPNVGLNVEKIDVLIKSEKRKVVERKIYKPVLELFSLSKKTCYYLKSFLMEHEVLDRDDQHFKIYLSSIGLSEAHYDILEPLLKDPTKKLYTKLLVPSCDRYARNVRIYACDVDDIVKIIYKTEDPRSSDVVVWK